MLRVCLLLVGLSVSGLVFAQEPPGKNSLVIFKTLFTYFGDQSDIGTTFQDSLGTLDAAIEDAVAALGSTAQVPLTFALDGDGLALIRGLPEAGGEVDSAAKDYFRPDDLDHLVRARYLLAPSLIDYELRGPSDFVSARLRITLLIIDRSTNAVTGPIYVDAEGRGDSDKAKAIRSAIDNLASKLVLVLNARPEFRATILIADMLGRDVLIDHGERIGLSRGDEFWVQRTDDQGQTKTIGIVAIRDIRGLFAFGQPVDLIQDFARNDQLIPIPRIGLDVDLYGDGIFVFSQFTNGPYLYFAGVEAGARVLFSRGNSNFRPFVSVATTVSPYLPGENDFFSPYLPITVAAGGEYVFALQHLRIAPAASVGLVQYIPTKAGYSWKMTFLQAEVRAQIGFRIFDFLGIFVEGGFAVNVAFDGAFVGYNGVLGGAGLRLKL